MIFKVHLRNCTYSKLTHSYLHNYILKEMPCWIILGNTLEIVENADDLEGSTFSFAYLKKSYIWEIGIKVCIPPEEEAIALKACGNKYIYC